MAEMKEEDGPATSSENFLTPDIDLSNYIRNDTPYPVEQVKRIENFYKKREKDQYFYRPTKTGDLAVYSERGELSESIHLLTHVPHSPEMREKMDQARLDAIGFAETKYEEALQQLRTVTANYKQTGSTDGMLSAQKAVTEADQILSQVRYRTRNIQVLDNPETRDIFFDQAKEQRKLISGIDPFKKKLFRLVTLEHPFYSFYGKYVESAPDVETGIDIDSQENKAIPAEGETRRRLKDGRMARIFFDVESNTDSNTFLSPCWPVEFTLDEVRYFTALQAFEAERARTAGQEALRASILRTRSTRTIRFLTKKFDTQPKDVKGLWLRILTAVYQQHPELLQKLMATGTDALVFADVRQGPSGTGVGEQSREVLDPARWTGENAMGIALETLRYQLREGNAKESARTESVKEAVITEEEQNKAKLGAIIQAKKKFQFKKPGAA